MMWLFILLAAIALFGLSCVYLVCKVQHFYIVKKMSGGIRLKSILISIAICVIGIALLMICLGGVNAVITVVYLILFWIVTSIIFSIGRRVIKRNMKCKVYVEGIVAIVVTCLYMIFAAYQDYGVWQKDYTIHTDKEVGDIKAVLIADSHVGTTFDGDGFSKHLKEIEKKKPDVLLISGDFVDDDTSLEDMKKSCEALGKVHTKYGIYYVFGNHDKGYYGSGYRGYSSDDLVKELKKNNVNVLQDESVLVDDRFYIIGRKDRSEELEKGGKRKSMAALTDKLDDTKYQIVLDHQPVDYAAQKESGVDMVLSGHTHGGQMLLMKIFQQLTGIGENNQIYGMEKLKNTNFIVTSGISDWAIKYKTGCRSEYVLINIEGK